MAVAVFVKHHSVPVDGQVREIYDAYGERNQWLVLGGSLRCCMYKSQREAHRRRPCFNQGMSLVFVSEIEKYVLVGDLVHFRPFNMFLYSKR